MPDKQISMTLDKDILEALDDFIDEFDRLGRSEAVETMIFYCLSNPDVTEEIGDIIDQNDPEDESEDEDEDDSEEEADTESEK